MSQEPTSWQLIAGAAGDLEGARDLFAQRYEPVLRAYFGARWRGNPRRIPDLEDAVQEVFLECLKSGGVLQRADPERRGGFRAFLYGVAKRVALRYETGHGRRREGRIATVVGDRDMTAADLRLSRVFDRSHALQLIKNAREHHRRLAAAQGDEALRRVELLRLRFDEDMPIRDIATAWSVEAAQVHRAYARARKEFRGALLEVLATEGGATESALESKADELLLLLGG